MNYRRVWEIYHKVSIPKGWQIHHRDGNRDNNCISNLLACPVKAHAKFHIHMDQSHCANWLVRGTRDLHGDGNPMWGKVSHLRGKTGDKHPCWGKVWSESERKRASDRRKGMVFSEEHIRNLSESHKGNALTRSQKDKISEKLKVSGHVLKLNNQTVTCPHCGKQAKGLAVMKRWHFDRCRHKE